MPTGFLDGTFAPSVFHLDTDTYSHMERLCPHPDLSPILSFIKQEQYCSAKLRFSRLNNVGISKKGVLDFFGSGYENLLIHILQYINRWMQESKCSSAALPKLLQVAQQNYLPTLYNVSSQSDFTEQLRYWLLAEHESTCMESIYDPTNNENIVWIENTEE